jgi:hypothetical protein
MSGNGNMFFSSKLAAKTTTTKNIDHHGPRHILFICHLPDPPYLSLVTALRYAMGH